MRKFGIDVQEAGDSAVVPKAKVTESELVVQSETADAILPGV